MSIGTFLSPRWRWATLAVILGMAFLVRLGIWQLDRLEWRREINAVKQSKMSTDPISLSSDLSGLVFEDMINQPVTASGTYDFEHQFLIESQIFESQPGRYLVTPLILEGSEQSILVNRGWVPDAEQDFAQFDEPGPIEIFGRVQKSQTLSGDRKTDVDGNKMFRIDVGAAAEVLPYPSLPIYLLPETDELVDSALPYLPKADLTLDEGSHFSYALQWFSFSILLAVMYGFLVYRRENRPTE